jgi:5'-nucleotidase
MTKPLIFLTNDDGVNAKGFRNLIDTVRPLGRIIAVAPENGQSGMSHAITMTRPLYLTKVEEEEGVEIYACSGTPVDCVKIAFDSLLLNKEMPALILSGINHGSNSAVNVLYSGTMAAAIEFLQHSVDRPVTARPLAGRRFHHCKRLHPAARRDRVA